MTVNQIKLSFENEVVEMSAKPVSNSAPVNDRTSVSKRAQSISALQEMALDLIGTHGNGLFQSELGKLLSIDRSKCSRVVGRLQDSGLICREKVPASSTYLLRLAHPSQPLHENSWHSRPRNHIDSYLTEFYLLYLLRGISA